MAVVYAQQMQFPAALHVNAAQAQAFHPFPQQSHQRLQSQRPQEEEQDPQPLPARISFQGHRQPGNSHQHHSTTIAATTNDSTQEQRTMKWTNNLPKSSTARYDAVATVMSTGGRASNELTGVVVVGGRSPQEDFLDTVEMFEWRLRRWWKLPSMTTPRSGCMATTINGNIFVAGGYHNERQLNSAEMYSFGGDSQKFEPLADMPTSRWHGVAVPLPRHNVVLVVGGRDDSWNELATMDAYNIEKNTWVAMENMKTPRFGCAAVALSHSKVLVIGGFDGKEWTTSNELYDFESDTWTSTKIAPMPHRVRFCVAATVVQDGKYVFVSGQADHGDTSDGSLVQCYNVNEDRWAVLHSEDLGGCAIAAIGENMFALGGLKSVSSKAASAEENADDEDSIISQDTRSWKVTDMNFAQLWGDEYELPTSAPQQRARDELPTPAPQQRARDELPTSASPQSAREPQPQDEPSVQESHHDNATVPEQHMGYLETMVVAVPVNHDSPPASVVSGSVHNQQASFMPQPPALHHGMDFDNNSIASSQWQYSTHQVPSQPMHPATLPPMPVAHQSSIPGPPSVPYYPPPSPAYSAPFRTGVAASSIVPSNMSVAASSVTSGQSDYSRRVVESESIFDNYGAPVVYTGQVCARTGKPHGKGRMTWTKTGDIYVGNFVKGARDGNGRMMYRNGDTFQGTYRDDQREGSGVYTYHKDGRTYDGIYVDDEQEDTNATMTWKNGTIYIGQFKQSKRTGKGMVRFPNQVKYSGDFLDGLYHGMGVCHFADASVYTGEWRKGRAHGQGKLVNKRGRVIHDGRWVNDGPA